MTTADARLLAQVRAAAERRGLSHAALAQRAGVHKRTVERLFLGKTSNRATLERLAEALDIPVDDDAREAALVREVVREELGRARAAAGVAGAPQDSAGARNRTQSHAIARTGCPVVGWAQAAHTLGMSHDTLQRRRKAYGDTTIEAWWRDEDSVRDWYEAIVQGAVRRASAEEGA